MKLNLPQHLPELSSVNTKPSRRSTPATALITSGSLLIALWFCLIVTDSSQLRRSSSRISADNARPAAGEKPASATQSHNNWLEKTDIDMEIGYGPLPDLKETVFLQGNDTIMYHWHLCAVVDQSSTMFSKRIRKRKFLSRWQAENQQYMPCLYCSRVALDKK